MTERGAAKSRGIVCTDKRAEVRAEVKERRLKSGD